MTNEQIISKYTGFSIESIQHIGDNCIQVMFTDGKGLEFIDDGQSCCEHRYMTIDDDLTEYVGAKFTSFDVVDAQYGDCDSDGDVHDVQFLRIHTSKGDLSIANHNEHNGYYGGFDVICTEIYQVYHTNTTTPSDFVV